MINSADYCCRSCGASIPWESGVCATCAPPSGVERRETAYTCAPGGGVCRCLNPDSPLVCEDCPDAVLPMADDSRSACAESPACGYLAECPDCDRCDDCCTCGTDEDERTTDDEDQP